MKHLLPSALLVLAALGLAPTPASAQTTVIYACASYATGQLRLVQHPRECHRTEKIVSWNITGPQGPAGPAGPIGPRGDQGIQGIQGPAGSDGAGIDLGAIAGTLYRCDGTAAKPAAGFMVGVPGRSFLAVSDQNGAFRVDHVTPGQYPFGAINGALVAGVAVSTQATTELGAIYTIDLKSDPANCGACGVQCGSGTACNNGTCGTVREWRTSDWGTCSVACGGGVRTRSVVCFVNGVPSADTECPF